MGLIGKFTTENMFIIFFIYGLAFFALGIAVVLSSLRPTSLKFAKYLPWLAAYGFAHGFHEWDEMLVLIPQYKFLARNWLYAGFDTVLLVGSPLFLFIFGVGLLMTIDERFRNLRIIPVVFYSAWTASVVGYLQLTGLGLEQSPRLADIFARYLLIFPGAIIAGFALFLQYRVFLKQTYGVTASSLFIAALALWLMAPLSGLVVPYAPFFPASVVNNDAFLSLTGFPIQIFRTLAALLIAFSIVRGMHVFNIEEERQEHRRRLELSTLEEISSEIRRNPNFPQALDRTTKEITKLFDARAGAIFMVSEKTRRPDVVSEHGFTISFADKYKDMPAEVAEKCPIRNVIKSQRPFTTSNRTDCPNIIEATTEPEKINAITVLPLVAKGQSIGAIALLFESAEALRPSNLDILNTFAGNIGLAIENARLDEQRLTALVLQRSLLPKVPSLTGIDIGVYYESASVGMEVGGDFYDFIDFGDGLLGLVIGDVAGAGINASSTVAMTKYALEAFDFENKTPFVVLEKLNNLACKMLSSGQFVTAFYGVLDIKSGLLTYSSAGHLPPLVINEKTKEAIFLNGARGMALGIVPTQKYPEGKMTVGFGDVIVLYTDGLIEARRKHDFWGEDRLVTLAKENYELSAQTLVDRICSSAKEFAGGILKDDVAAVVAKRTFTQA